MANGLIGGLRNIGNRLGTAFGFDAQESGRELEEELRRRASGEASLARIDEAQRQNAALAQTLAASNAGVGNPALAQRQAAEFLQGANAAAQQEGMRQRSAEQLQAAQQLDMLEQRRRALGQQGLGNLLSTAGSVGGFIAKQNAQEDLIQALGGGGGASGGGASLPGGQLMQSNGVGGIASALTGEGGAGGAGLGTLGSLAGTAVGGPLGGVAGGALGDALGGKATAGQAAANDVAGAGAALQQQAQGLLDLTQGPNAAPVGAASASTPGSGRSMAQMQASRAQAQAEKDELRREFGLAPEPLTEDEFLQGLMEGRF